MAKKKIQEIEPVEEICWTVNDNLVLDFKKEKDGYTGYIGEVQFFWNKEGKRSDGLYSELDLDLK